jgi:Flp pilus assembly protein TadB
MIKNQKKDYWQYDYIDLTSKIKSADELSKSYAVFGWEEIERYADKLYVDVVHLSFRRPHKIQNKDDLQYLQVTYERLFNERAVYEYKKHERSSLILTLYLLFIIIVASAGLLTFINAYTLSTKIISGIVVGACAVCLFFVCKHNKFMRKKENEKFLKKSNKIDSIIQQTLIQAETLVGDRNEK